MNRRSFFKTSAAAAGGLLVGFYLPETFETGGGYAGRHRYVHFAKLNAFVRVGTDDSVTLTIHRAELGQGSVTALSMLLAEELECDWNKIDTEFAKVDPANYGVFGSPDSAGRFRKPEHPHLMGSSAQGRRDCARNARERRGAEVGRRSNPIAARKTIRLSTPQRTHA